MTVLIFSCVASEFNGKLDTHHTEQGGITETIGLTSLPANPTLVAFQDRSHGEDRWGRPDGRLDEIIDV